MKSRAGTTNAALPAVIEDLLTVPGAFAFTQATDIAGRLLRAEGREVNEETFRYSVNPDLSFPPGDIASLRFEDTEDGRRVALMLNLMGLHGAGSPLPAYFTEHIAQHQDEPDALRDFFNIFNHRLVGLLRAGWYKYRYYARYRTNASDRLSNLFIGFIGMGHAELRAAKKLRWPRIMAYMGLIAFNRESPGTLERVLRHYFSHPDISIVPCIRRWVAVPDDQRTRLGVAGCRLGEDFILGDDVPDQTGKFRIRIAELTWDRFNEFLPSGELFAELQTLVRFVLRSRLDFDVELRLRPEEIRPWRLESAGGPRLGWSVWAGEGGDGVVVLETDHREL